ncbi:MAG: tRNA epoxyqueuosine(34) reductase QueG [Myxococcota bacterium]
MNPPASLSERVRALGLALGFDLVGVAPAAETPGADRLRDWLASGYDASMGYIGRRVEERLDVGRVLEGARSVVCVALQYAPGDGTGTASGGASGTAREPDRAGPVGRVARYAGGEDYHAVLADRLAGLGAALEALAEAPVRWRAYVDTGPVQERAFAARAGLGWIGKNACLIHPRLGSYLLLGVLVSDLALEPDAAEPDHCGTCRACLDACPTRAFPEPYVVDARRCIAHATIEDPGPVPEALRAGHGGWIFGCDICQEVCPWNGGRAGPHADPLGLRERLAPDPRWQRASLAWVLSLDEPGWREATRRSALRRARHGALLRNALVAAGNSGDPALRPAVERHCASDDALVAEHARWAAARLDEASSAPG